MGRGELLSTLSMYNYDNTLFDEFVIPNVIDRTDMIDRILLETAEFEVVLPDFDTYKTSIGIWSRLRLDAWQKMADVLFKTGYNPFFNLDKKETKTYDLATSDDNTRTLDNQTEETRDMTDTNSIMSFDSNTFQNREQDVRGGTDTFANSGTITDEGDGTKTGTITTEVVGINSVLSPDAKAKVVKAEVDLRLLYDLEDLILQDFKKEFCLLVY